MSHSPKAIPDNVLEAMYLNALHGSSLGSANGSVAQILSCLARVIFKSDSTTPNAPNTEAGVGMVMVGRKRQVWGISWCAAETFVYVLRPGGCLRS